MGWEAVKKARERLSREQGTVSKDWGGRIPVALIYPNSYFVGMSNLGIHAIYRLLNSDDNVVCERAFWEKENRGRNLPPLSLESQRPLSDFAVLAFSISYELDYLNIVPILKAAGIPPYAADRDERHPLIIAGGPCVTANPMPVSPFFDCLGIGEAEAIMPPVMTAISEGISRRREDLLKRLASLPGIYAPQYHDGAVVSRQWMKSLDGMPAASSILTPDTELGNLYLIEVERGCHWSCRFCLARNAFHPMRAYQMDKLIDQAKQGLKHRLRLGLVGAAVPDHPRIEDLLVKLRQLGAELSISSLRIKPLSLIVLREIAGGGAQTIALAPEAGSQRLRQVINKGISEDDILEAMGKVARQGIKNLKLYFMIGLPSETDEDIEAMIDLTIKCKSILDEKPRGSRLILNIAPFIPKAGTPFQWLPMASLATLKERLSRVKNRLQPKGIKIKSESPGWSEVQAVLSRGDASVAGVLTNMEEVSLAGWRQAAAGCRLDIDYYAHQMWDTAAKLPWGWVDLGVSPERLKKELEQALEQSRGQAISPSPT